ncbi:MAG: hypothetical protein JWR42_2411, partial [Marmoricola sp.]|nr:hypothetical protein [Marmoricola sp.]
GVNATDAQKVFDRRYVPRVAYGQLHVFELRHRVRTFP